MSEQPGKVSEAMGQLRARVLASPKLLASLRSAPDLEAFVNETLRVASEMKIAVTAIEIQNALRAARRECLEHWD